MANHPVIGRRLTDEERRSVVILMEVSQPPATAHVYTDGTHDFTCFTSPIANCVSCYIQVDMTGYPNRYADVVDAQRPVFGSAGGSSDAPFTMAWGAVAPKVSRLTVTVGNGEGGDVTGDATIDKGYFIALLSPGPCCLISYVAYDSSGAEIFRSD